MKKNIIISILFILVCCSYLLMLFKSDVFIAITKEDSFVENLGAAFYFIASLFFFYNYITSKGSGNNLWKLRTEQNMFCVLLGSAFFCALGEEISWGQRIFGWGTPEPLCEANWQEETNIHNINFFMKSGLSFERLFNLFWMTYCLLIPLLNKYSVSSAKFFKSINLPIAPFWIGFLLLTNYIIIHIIQYFHIYSINRIFYGALEIKETNYAFIFMALSAYWMIVKPFGTKTD